VFYEVVDGLAVVEGDIILGRADQLDEWSWSEQASTTRREGDVVTRGQPLTVVSNLDKLWPDGVIPYEFHRNLSATMRNRADTAAQNLTSQTNLTVRRRQNGDDDFVRIRPAGGCSSRIGMGGGRQLLRVSNSCSVGNIMHEFLHAAGVFHEQSRSDRDEYVDVNLGNVESGKRSNFRIARDSQALGPYDYGSIMHYGSQFFSKDGCSGDECVTIDAPAGVSIGQRSGLSTQDIEGINLLYPIQPGPEFGAQWGDQNYATAVAFGDVDGDGRDELGVGRRAGTNNRFWVLDSPTRQNFDALFSGGDSWGSGGYVTDLDFGDIDGDGRDELVVTRHSSVNARYFIYDDANAGFTLLHQGGDQWGSGNYATSAALGDIDGDGRDEIAIGRRAGSNDRFFVFDDAAASRPFRKIAGGGDQWGGGNYVTDVAFGDVDGDGDDELGVARRAGSNGRYYVLDYNGGSLNRINQGGERWGDSYYATSIAFGDIDGDPAEEMIVGRRASENARYFVFDDRSTGFEPLSRGGDAWGSGYHTVGVAIADFDGDGVGELAIARNAGEHGRYFLRDGADADFAPITPSGKIWPQGVGATDIALGDGDGDGDADLAVTRREEIRGRTRFEVIISN
jgi:hypothetical protein